LAVVIFAAAVSSSCGESAEKRIAHFRSSIASESPAGSTKAEVIAYLSKNRIEHSGYKEAGSEDELKFFGAPGRIDAMIRAVEKTMISRVDIRMVFLFEGSGKMLRCDVSQVVTSL
jgi:hypothetical protein